MTAHKTISNDPERKLLTVQEAMDTLRISRWTLYSLLRRNQLRSVKFGTRRLIPASEIDALIERLKDQPYYSW